MLYAGHERRKQRSQFRCPACGSWEQQVVDSRGNPEGTQVRRRHECEECGHRYTSLAMIASTTTGSVDKSS